MNRLKWPWKPKLTRQDLPLDEQLSEFYASVFGATGGRGDRLAERVGAASRCLQLGSQLAGSLELKFSGAYRPMWLDSPDPNWFNEIGEAISAGVYSYYRWGDAFLYVTGRYADSDYPRSWTVLDNPTMKVDLEDGRRVYTSNGVRLNARDVLQVGRQPGMLRSAGALEAYWANINSAMSADTMATGMFHNGGVPHAVLKPQRRLTQAQAEELQQAWINRVGAGTGAPAVIPPDVQFEQLQFSPKELMLLELREFDQRAIAAAFGVPSMLLNLAMSGSLVYQNPAMLFDFYWRSELFPTAGRFARAMTAKFLPAGNYAKFSSWELVRPDPAEFMKMLTALVEKGIITVDEARAAGMDLPPLAEGQQLEELSSPSGTGTSPKLSIVEGSGSS